MIQTTQGKYPGIGMVQAPVVQKMDNTIHRINHYISSG